MSIDTRLHGPPHEHPDVTDVVMERLGFVRVTAGRARRDRRRRLIRRCLGCAGVLLVILLGSLDQRDARQRSEVLASSDRFDRVMDSQATLLNGLAAPFKRLEQLVEPTEGGLLEADADQSEPILIHGPRTEEAMRPFLELERSSFTPFPSS